MNKASSRKVLQGVGERLKAANVAAKLTPSEDAVDVLTVLLPEKINGEELFVDVFFFPDDEKLEGVSLFTVRAELLDLSRMEEERIGDFLVRLSSANSTLPLGGYGVSTTEGKLPLQTLVFKATVPVIPGITGERMETEVMETLTLCSSVLQTSLPEILESVQV